MLNNIKSSFILKRIFNYLRNKIKLKIIKYNKNILYRLNITDKDFIVYESLKEFNNKYNLYINDIDNKVLNLNKKNLNDEALVYFNLIKFNKLIILDLSQNNILNINALEKVNFSELRRLNLSENKISDINTLEKIDLKNLEELDLSENNITDINTLKNGNYN